MRIPRTTRHILRRGLSTASTAPQSSPGASPTPTEAGPDALPPSSIPLLTTLPALRAWRARARRQGQSVGFVPTMGALHSGHVALVQRSLQENDLTILSIFVNPTQFAPHEDLASYPRTLASDLQLLSSVSCPVPPSPSTAPPPPTTTRTPSAIFLPSLLTMYPSGAPAPSPAAQTGTFVSLPGFSHQMEGLTRPHFFRGVATVVTKLFNAVEPSAAYFGQKDIQQGLLLRRMCADLLLDHPAPARLHIVPTARAQDGLALSSRNAYLSPAERSYAPTLHRALLAAQRVWATGAGRAPALAAAHAVIQSAAEQAERDGDGVLIKLDYVEMNDPESFEVVSWETAPGDGRAVILSGAMWVGRTRLIDNVILGDEGRVVR